MIEKVYIIRRDHCNPFKGSRHDSLIVRGTIQEAMSEFRKSAQYDYHYAGNDYSHTYLPYLSGFRYTPDPQRWHAREAWQWDEKAQMRAIWIEEEEDIVI